MYRRKRRENQNVEKQQELNMTRIKSVETDISDKNEHEPGSVIQINGTNEKDHDSVNVTTISTPTFASTIHYIDDDEGDEEMYQSHNFVAILNKDETIAGNTIDGNTDNGITLDYKHCV